MYRIRLSMCVESLGLLLLLPGKRKEKHARMNDVASTTNYHQPPPATANAERVSFVCAFSFSSDSSGTTPAMATVCL